MDATGDHTPGGTWYATSPTELRDLSAPAGTDSILRRIALEMDRNRSEVAQSIPDPWDRSSSTLTPSSNLDTLPNGVYSVWSGTTATVLGLPQGTLGTLTVTRYGTAAGSQTWLTRETSPTLWARSELSGGWGPWTRIGASSAGITTRLRAATPAGYKTAPLALTLGHGGSSTTGTGTTVAAQRLPSTVTRARLHLRNRNPRYDMADSPPVAISNTAIGLSNGSGGSAAWTTLPGTGSTPWVSQWVTVPADWHGKEIAVRYAWSSTGTIQRNIGTAWTGSTRDNAPPLHAWLEVEVPASTPVVAALGDSLTAGVGAGAPVMDSWLGQFAREIGAVPAHWAHSGDSAVTWTDTVNKWWLYGPDIAAPDALVHAIGSNDIFGGITLAEAQSRITNATTLLRDRISPNLYAATILPRTNTTGTPETVRRQVNTWLRSSGHFRDVFDFAAAISNDDETIRPEFDADGIHLNTAGYAALAAAVARPVVPA